MKKIVFLLVSVISVTEALANDVMSKTFFSVLSPFRTGLPEKDSMYRDALIFKKKARTNMEVVVFGKGSVRSKKLARYFLPFGKSELLVAEQNAPQAAERDVDAVHLNINHDAPGNTFQSKVKFRPKYTVAGVGFGVRHRISDELNSWWFAASAPLVQVTTSVCLKEDIQNPGGVLQATRVANVTQAFKQSIWKFGKIDGCRHRKFGLADIELQIGYQWDEAESCYFDLFLGLVVPTGNKPQACLVFEPMVGNNKHVGLMFGGTYAKQLYESHIGVINFIASGCARYLFSNTQRRSFDLTDKQWGRYMEVYNNIEAAEVAAAAPTVADGDHGSPGINVFTQCVHVTPGFLADCNAALLYTRKWFHGECGYNLNARQAEQVCLERCWQEGPALVSASQIGRTTKSRTINHGAAGADNVVLPSYAVLKQSDLDLSSAAHPAAVNHRVYISLGGELPDHRDISSFVALGSSYEFSSNNASLNCWAGWAKVGVNF